MIETDTGYFINGAYFEGVLPEQIGKKIIHVGRVKALWGWDGSGCTIAGNGTPNSQDYNYVIVHEILPDGQLLVELIPHVFPGRLSTLPKEWNTGKWVEVEVA